MKKNIYLITFLVFTFSSTYTFAQKFVLSGHLYDASSGEGLINANISVKNTNYGVTTNSYGFYSITLPKGNYTVSYSYLGFETQNIELPLDKSITKNIELHPKSSQLEEIIVGATKNKNIINTEVSVLKLNVKDAKKIPVLLGEQDVLKTIQLMPGVNATSEGSSGFSVRGGDADQNLILLDEAPIYNASHLLGFFSVFNSDALKDIKLYKGGIPAKYGGKVSSVLDIRMKDGNSKKWRASGGIGLISSRLAVEGPLAKDKSSIVISGRRTYLDLIARAVSDEIKNEKLYFYDLNLKANYKISEDDKLYVSGYLGRDVLGTKEFGFSWGNKTLTLRWNHIFNNKLFTNTSLIYSDYNYGFNIKEGGTEIDLISGIYDYNLKQDYTYYLNSKHRISFGWNGIFHRFKPSAFSFENLAPIKIEQRKALEAALYASNKHKISNKLSMEYGFRVSSLSNVGPYTEKAYTHNNDLIKETSYKSGSFYKNYFNFEPRLNTTYILNNNNSFKFSYNRIAQYMHMLSNTTSESPTDMWIPTSPKVKPTLVDQITLGYFRNFSKNMYQFNVESYYKNLSNTVDYKDGAKIYGNPNLEQELTFGRGRAYGIELLLKKTKGKFTGWIGYTLSKSERQFNEINDGNWFSTRQDRTHDFSIVGTYELNRKVTLSATWVYNTGDAVTFPVGKYKVDNRYINLYTNRNGDRMPDYHRLDLGLTWVLKDSKSFYNDLSFSIYNAYARKNAYAIYYEQTSQGSMQAKRLSLFSFLPSIAWNFKF